jgi:hypothetical protein
MKGAHADVFTGMLEVTSAAANSRRHDDNARRRGSRYRDVDRDDHAGQPSPIDRGQVSGAACPSVGVSPVYTSRSGRSLFQRSTKPRSGQSSRRDEQPTREHPVAPEVARERV